MSVGSKVSRQLKSDTFKNDNPLGRVMQVRDKYPQADTEALELAPDRSNSGRNTKTEQLPYVGENDFCCSAARAACWERLSV